MENSEIFKAMKRQWNILITGSWLNDMENSEIFKTKKKTREKTMEHSDHRIMTEWHGKHWDFQSNEKTMEHSDHWIMTEWHGEQRDFQNNEKTREKTMEHSDHRIMTDWHGKHWDFQNNKKTRRIVILIRRIHSLEMSWKLGNLWKAETHICVHNVHWQRWFSFKLANQAGLYGVLHNSNRYLKLCLSVVFFWTSTSSALSTSLVQAMPTLLCRQGIQA